MPYLGVLEVLEEISGSFAASQKKFFFGRFGTIYKKIFSIFGSYGAEPSLNLHSWGFLKTYL